MTTNFCSSISQVVCGVCCCSVRNHILFCSRCTAGAQQSGALPACPDDMAAPRHLVASSCCVSADWIEVQSGPGCTEVHMAGGVPEPLHGPALWGLQRLLLCHRRGELLRRAPCICSCATLESLCEIALPGQYGKVYRMHLGVYKVCRACHVMTWCRTRLLHCVLHVAKLQCMVHGRTQYKN